MTTYHVDEDLDKLTLVARLDARKDLSGGAGKHINSLLLGELLELSSGEASLFNVGILGDDAELLSDRDSSLFGITSDHDDIDAGSLALVDGALDLGSGRVPDANITKEGAVALVVLVLLVIGEHLGGVLTGDFFHISTVKCDGDAEDTESLSGNALDLLFKSVLLGLSKLGLLA